MSIATIDFTPGTTISSSAVENKFNEIINNGNYPRGIPRVILNSVAILGNVGAGLDTILSYSLPANSLANNGDFLEIDIAGILASNDNDKRLFIDFGAQSIDDTGLIDVDGIGWSGRLTITRLTATTVIVTLLSSFGYLQFNSGGTIGGGSSGRVIGRTANLTVADLVANATVFRIQAEATADNDVTNNRALIKLCQMT